MVVMHRMQFRETSLGVTERAVLERLAEPFRGTVARLAAVIERPEVATWKAIAYMSNQGYIRAERCREGVSLRITQQGRAMIVRNPPGGNPRRTTSPRRNSV